MSSFSQSSPRLLTRSIPLICLFAVAGCAVAPKGPSILALPGSGKSFETFQIDDSTCRGYATAQIGGADANKASTDSAVRSAALGTIIGAAAGAAIGGHRGVGAGAGTGLLFGSVAGAGAGEASARGSQRSFDNAYVQCMYAKGHHVPIAGEMRAVQRRVIVQDGTYAPGTPPMAPGYSSQMPVAPFPPPPAPNLMPPFPQANANAMPPAPPQAVPSVPR